jgi:hypothetical protein
MMMMMMMAVIIRNLVQSVEGDMARGELTPMEPSESANIICSRCRMLQDHKVEQVVEQHCTFSLHCTLGQWPDNVQSKVMF